MGYMNSMWAFGIPLGGIYWLWKIKNKKEEDEDEERLEIANNEILDNVDNE